MPAGPGESLLTTLFADIHYYFNAPASKPQHHRFSKGSYFYLFHNALSQQAKIEIANHAGTPDQDAFSGYLNAAVISYSYKQPTLFMVSADGTSVQGHDQWHIPSYNERNEQKYLYKIHTIDAYLWTEKDAGSLLGHLKNILPADRLEIKDAPKQLQSPSEHRDSMSPVVQQLEKTAIGSHFPPRAESTASAQSLPGPPTPASGAATSPPAQQAPMAYNPAAPAAPEAVVYREKTPPPVDDGSGTGLANAAKYDSMPQQQYANVPHSFQPSQQSTPQQSYFPGPPQQQQQFPGPPQGQPQPQRTHSGSLPPPPPPPAGGPFPLQQQQSYNPSFASPPTSPPAGQAHFNRQSSFSSGGGGGPPGQTQFATYQPSQAGQGQPAPSFGPGALASPGLPGTPGQQPPTPGYNPQQQQQYSQYQYQPQPPSQGGYDGALHGQTYTPTAAEVQANPKLAQQTMQWQQQQQQQQQQQATGGAQGQQPSMGGRVEAYEKKVGGFLKRLDRKFGV